MGGALERDPDLPAFVPVQVPGLLGHGIADQLAEDGAHQAGGHAEIGGHGDDPVEHPALAVGVLDGGVRLLFYRRDGLDQVAALRDQAHDPAVDLIQALPQAV